MKNKNYLLFVVLLVTLNACQALKDGLQGNKRSKSSEEFLIDQKNPLVIPPDFESLPEPTNTENDSIEKNDKIFDINEIIGELDDEQNKVLKIEDDSLEKSIIKIIKQK